MLLTITTLYSYYPAAFWVCLGMTLLLAGAGVGGAVELYRRDSLTVYDAIVASLLWCYAVAVLYFTVIGRYAHTEYRVDLTLFDSYRKAFADGDTYKLKNIFLNLAMLAPVAFLFAELAGRKKRRLTEARRNSIESQLTREPTGVRLRWIERHPALAGALAAILFSIIIECLQYVSSTGTFELDDILNNAIGAIIAACVWTIWSVISRKRFEKRTH